MKFCIAKDVITPDQPVFQGGFAARTQKSTGVNDDVFVKTILLQADKSMLIITLDVTGGDRSFVHGIKNILNEKFDLKADEILINFSHSHASVKLTGEDQELRNGYYSIDQEQYINDQWMMANSADIRYYNQVKDKIVHLVAHCFEHAEEGTLQWTKGSSSISVSRRLMTEEGIKWAPNYDADIDRDLFVLKLENAKGELKGILFSHGCHPTCMGPQYLISAEFVGHACRLLEGAYEGTTAAFMQGCAAEIKPMKGADGDRFKQCTIQEMQGAGVDFADEVKHVLETGAFKPVKAHFRTQLLNTRLLVDPLSLPEYEEMLQEETREVYRKFIRRSMRVINEGNAKDDLHIYIMIWELDEETQIIALEGEISTQYSLMIKKLFPDKTTIVLGYSNGLPTYIPTRQILQERGYEAEAYKMNRLRGPFVPEIEDIIIGQIAEAGFQLGKKI